MTDPTELAGWLTPVKLGIDILKSAKDLMPRGKDKDALQQKITEAEDALSRADAKLAKELGYKLCECTFPPQIMFWNEPQKMFVCPNQNCGRETPRGIKISDEVIAKAGVVHRR